MIWGNPTNNVLEILEFDSDKPSKKDQGQYTKSKYPSTTHYQGQARWQYQPYTTLNYAKDNQWQAWRIPFQIQVFE